MQLRFVLASSLLLLSCSSDGSSSGPTASSSGDPPGATSSSSSAGGGGTSSAGGTGTGGGTSVSATTSAASTSSGGVTTGGGAGGSDATGGGAGEPVGCTREGLAAATKAYVAALPAHDPAKAPIAPSARYTENTEEVEIGEGLWETAGPVKLHRYLVDTEQCATVSEVVLPESGEDVVMALRLKVERGSITEVEAIITREGDWLFDAQGYVDSRDQTWDVLPAEQRSTREELIAAAKAYFDVFSDPSVKPPFGEGCERLEGGAAKAPCPVGIPEGVTIGNRRYFADVEAGVSVGIVLFGGQSVGLLDAHFFRLIDGTIRNVHSMTVNERFSTTGWPAAP